ncbi:MAG: prephenate dehydratase [Verrucomicrobia bacterium]|nr:prephenate dehydratase [Verrucomicrobiota bacterium]
MNISSRVLWAVLGALYLLGGPVAPASEATLHGDLAFLGPKGSYSDEAAGKYVSRAHLDGTTALTTITEIAQSVGESRVQFGLLPFENSIGGFVGETHKLLLAPQAPGWRVIADVTIPISNNLLVKPGTKASDLRKIVSHPEALKECANWLKTNFPRLDQENISSTGAAAEAVANGDGTIAAIASSAAARAYQLQVLFQNIQDDQHNATNFIVIQAAARDFPEQNPTRLIVRLDVKQGGNALARLVEDLKHLSFALTSADSGPTGTLGSRRFILIFDSLNGADFSQIQNALRPIGALLIGAYRPLDITP